MIAEVFSLKPRWLLGGYRLEYVKIQPLRSFGLSILIDGILREVIDFPLQSKLAIRNIKGRDASNTLGLLSGASLPPLQHELLFVRGSIFSGNSSKYELMPYALRVLTEFDSFPADGGITHLQQVQLSGEAVKCCEPKDIGRAFPLKPLQLRCGIDLFGERMFLSSLGSTPVVNETLLIEANETHAAVGIFAEHVKSEKQLPLTQGNLYGRVKKVLNAATTAGLFDDLEMRMLYQVTA